MSETPAPRVIVHHFRDRTTRVVVGIPTGDIDECDTDDESEILSDVIIFGTDGETYPGPVGFKDFYGCPTRNGPDHMGGSFEIDPRRDEFGPDPYVDHDPTGRVVDWFDHHTETLTHEIAELREKLADAERNLSHVIAAATAHPVIGPEGIPSHLTPTPTPDPDPLSRARRIASDALEHDMPKGEALRAILDL